MKLANFSLSDAQNERLFATLDHGELRTMCNTETSKSDQ